MHDRFKRKTVQAERGLFSRSPWRTKNLMAAKKRKKEKKRVKTEKGERK